MRRKKPGYIRGLALLLAMLTVFSLPISAMASTASQEDEIVSYASSDKQTMINHDAFKALLYLGYDKDGYLRKNDYLFESGYYGRKLYENHPSSLTDVAYDQSGAGNGLQTSTTNTGYLSVPSQTGKYPNVKYFEDNTGLDCVDYAAYYLTNYLRNIVGKDLSALDELLSKYSGYTYDNMWFWPKAREDMVAAGIAEVYTVNSVDFYNGEISKYTNPSGETKTDDIYEHLEAGALVQMGTTSSEAVHYAIYVGTYNGKHFIAHSGNADRGPEITEIEYMSPEYSSSSKASVPLYFYEITYPENYGRIEINKKDPNGKNLAGAEFLVQNTSTKVYYETDPTNANGYTIFKDLPLGTYTVTETTYPNGYGSGPVPSWTVTLTKDTPNATVTVDAINYPLSLEIIKNTGTGTNLAGWQFQVFNNAPFKQVTLGTSTLNREYRVKITDKDGNAVYSDPAKLTTEGLHFVSQQVQYASVGDTVTYEIEMVGDGNYTYQWQYNSGPGSTWNNAGSKTTKYSFTYAAHHHTHQYRCIVTDNSKSPAVVYYSEPAAVLEEGSPTITSQPTSAAAKVGESATFSITAPGASSTYIWMVSSDGGANWSEHYGGSTFTYTKKTATDQLVKCVIRDNSGNKVMESRVVHLYGAEDGEGVQIVAHPTDQSAAMQGKVIFEVAAVGDELVYEWQYRDAGSDTWHNAGSYSAGAVTTYTTGSDGKFTIHGIPAGNYYVAELDNGKDGWIYDYPKAVTVTKENTSVNPATVTFTNNLASGNMEIIKDTNTGTHLGGWSFQIFANTPSKQIQLSLPSLDREYRAKITDKFGNVVYTDPAKLTGFTGIRFVSSQNQFHKIGDKVTYKIEVIGDGEYTYQWQWNSGPGSNWSNGASQTTEYGFTMASNHDTHQYRCIVTDISKTPAVTYYSDVANVYLNTSAVILSSPKNAAANVGETATFSVDVNGYGYSYSWRISSDGGATWTSKSSANGAVVLTKGDAYDELVKCVITRPATTTLSAVSIETEPVHFYRADGMDANGVYGGIQIIEQPKDQAIEMSQFGTFEVLALGDGLIYEWEYREAGSDTWVSDPSHPAGFEGTYTTDDSGKVSIENIPAGDYFVVELNTGKPGWEYDETPKPVTVTKLNTPDNPATVTFKNILKTGDLDIIKDTEDGLNKDGWLFNLYGDEGCTDLLMEGLQTDADGKLHIGELVAGDYWVKEMGHIDPAISEIYECGTDNPAKVTVIAGDTVSVTFINNLKFGSLLIEKHTNTGDRLSGWPINVYAPDDTLVPGSPFVTDETGKVLIENLLPGTYRVVEVGNESEYWDCDVEAKEANVTPGKVVIVQITNTVYGKLDIKKELTDGTDPSGWPFNVYAPDGSLVPGSPFISDEAGYIHVGNLIPGIYVVEEVLDENSDYVVVGSLRQEIEVKPEETASVTFTNTPKTGSLLIQKETNTGNNKDGWPFNVYMGSVAPENLLPGSPFYTDENGQVLIEGLRIGTYVVVELDEGKDLWVCDVEEKAVVVTYQGTATVTVKNIHLGRGELTKETPNGGTKEGWIHEIRTESGVLVGTYETNASGKIVVELEPGTYYITEVGPTDEYWELDTEVKVLTIYAGNVTFVSTVNHWYGKLHFTKQTTDNSPTSGKVFEVRTEDGKLIGSYTSDENGTVVTDLIAPGDYLVSEVLPADSLYQVVGENPKAVTVTGGQTTDLTFINAPRSGSILGYKVSEQGIKLAGAKFLLEWSDDGGETWNPVTSGTEVLPGLCSSEGLVDGCLVSDEEGIIHFTGLHPSLTYRLTEVEAPPGFALAIDSVFTGVLTESADLTATFTIINTETIQIPATGDLVDAPFMTAFFILTALGTLFVCAMGTIVTVKKIRVKDEP